MKVAVITGASQGIGNAIAKKFSENGYRVFNLSRTPAEGIESIKTDVPLSASADAVITE